MTAVPILLAAPGFPGEPALVAALGHPGSPLAVVRRCVDAVDLLGAAARGSARAAVVTGTLPRLTRETVARLADSGVVVLGIAEDPSGEGARRLGDLGVRCVILPGIAVHGGVAGWTSGEDIAGGAEEVVGILAGALAGEDASHSRAGKPAEQHYRTLRDREPGTSEARGRLVAVWGPHGAPGRTSVAIALADEAARAGVPALLVDADTYGGAIAARLGIVDDVSGLIVACRHADTGALDPLGLASAARAITPGLRVLTGISRGERWAELRPAALAQVWRACRQTPGICVADVGFSLEDDHLGDARTPRRNGAALSAIEAADVVVAVGVADQVGIERLVLGLEQLHRVAGGTPVRVVVTRVRKSSLGRRPEEQVAEALRRHAGVEDVAFVPDDPAAFDSCLRHGRTLAERAGSSPARVALRALADEVMAGARSESKGEVNSRTRSRVPRGATAAAA